MDKIAIVQKHLSGFKELRPDNKTKPREPKLPKKMAADSMEKHLKKMEKYNEKMAAWHEADSRNRSMRQIEISADGVLTCGSPYRMVRMKDVPNEMEETYYLDGEGKSFPNFNGVIDRLTNPNSITLTIDKEVVNFFTTISKACDVGAYTFGPRGILFRPVRSSQEDLLSEARLERAFDLIDTFQVGLSSVYLVELCQLVKKLEIETLEICYHSPIRPFLFKAENFEYVIAPVRIN